MPFQEVIHYKDHVLVVTPRRLESGQFEAQAQVMALTPSGFTGSFSALGEFAESERAAGHALRWVCDWIDVNFPGDEPPGD